MSREQQFLYPVFTGGYTQKVLDYSPIAYWPLDEASGSVARCLVNSAQNGAYTGVTLGQNVIDANGTAFTCPWFDGNNDYVDIKTAALEAALNAGGAQWSFMAWTKINAAMWVDDTARHIGVFVDSANDRFGMTKTAAHHRVYGYWVGGGTVEDHIENLGTGPATWQLRIITRDETADEIKYYADGALLAPADTTIGTWASSGTWIYMVLGALSTVPTEPWHGWLAHVALFPFALSQLQIDDLLSVEG